MTRKPRKGRPGGRPRKDDPALRSEWLRARVTAAELHRAEQLMRDAGHQTQSDFVREAVFTAKIVITRHRTIEPIFLHDLSRLSQEFSRVGNVVNQIARIANTVGDLRRKQILDAMLAELRGLVDEARPIVRRLYELE
jgi:MobC-like protein